MASGPLDIPFFKILVDGWKRLVGAREYTGLLDEWPAISTHLHALAFAGVGMDDRERNNRLDQLVDFFEADEMTILRQGPGLRLAKI